MDNGDEPVRVPGDVKDHVAVQVIGILKRAANFLKIVPTDPSTILTHASISFAASGYCFIASLKCLRVTRNTYRENFTICEVVKR
jgi:hypothetical protein